MYDALQVLSSVRAGLRKPQKRTTSVHSDLLEGDVIPDMHFAPGILQKRAISMVSYTPNLQYAACHRRAECLG